jgi:hypothetical protein
VVFSPTSIFLILGLPLIGFVIVAPPGIIGLARGRAR